MSLFTSISWRTLALWDSPGDASPHGGGDCWAIDGGCGYRCDRLLVDLHRIEISAAHASAATFRRFLLGDVLIIFLLNRLRLLANWKKWPSWSHGENARILASVRLYVSTRCAQFAFLFVSVSRRLADRTTRHGD